MSTSLPPAVLRKALTDVFGGEFETCNERECYACHPSVLPG